MKMLKDMTIKEMAEEYNNLTESSIKKFASRKTAIKRLGAVREELKDQLKNVKSTTRSQAISESWVSLKTRTARTTRHHVVVEGHGEFRSVKQAFETLGLPLNKHIKFRGRLKKEGKLSCEHEGSEGVVTVYKFTLIKR